MKKNPVAGAGIQTTLFGSVRELTKSTKIEKARDLDAEIDDILVRHADKHPHALLHTVQFF